MDQSIKKEFLEREILTWSIVGGLSRGRNVYTKETKESDRNALKRFLRKELRDRFDSNYRPDSEHHINNLKGFKNDIDIKFREILEHKEIYFGRVQKIVNLYLKYRWVCFGEQRPIHCPIDSIILKELGLSNVYWTAMTMAQYKTALAKIKSTSIAEWEIDLFNRKNITYKQ